MRVSRFNVPPDTQQITLGWGRFFNSYTATLTVSKHWWTKQSLMYTESIYRSYDLYVRKINNYILLLVQYASTGSNFTSNENVYCRRAKKRYNQRFRWHNRQHV